MMADGDERGNADATSEAVMPTRPVKRSFSISGHRTSVSLETAFWTALRDIADDRGRPLAALVAEIDRNRGDAGLSGAIRVYVLAHYRRLCAGERPV